MKLSSPFTASYLAFIFLHDNFVYDQVRSVCKPLKALGIHSVSLHAGASLDHQIQGWVVDSSL